MEKQLLSRFEFLQKFDDNTREKFLNNIQIHDIEVGETVFDSTVCNGIMLVLEGRFRVYMLSNEGREITLYHLEEGDVSTLSINCITGTMPIKAIVTAEQKSKIAKLNNDFFMELHKESFELQKFVLENMSNQMYDIMWIVEQIAFNAMDKRVATYLISQNSKIIYNTHEEIANNLGTAREVISRMLKYFEKNNIVKLARGKIYIENIDLLQKIIEDK